MRRIALETLKIILLFFSIFIGVIIFDKDTVEAKARKIQDRKGNLHQELSRKERDEYMEYLKALNNFYYEDPIFARDIE